MTRLADATGPLGVTLQITRFHNEEERLAFYDEQLAIDPAVISVAGYERTDSGLLVNLGRRYVAKMLVESSVAAGGSADTTVRFVTANTYIGVGDSATAAAQSQTDLQAATNKLKKVVDTGFPKYPIQTYDRANPTTGVFETVTLGDGDFVARSTFASTEAAFRWTEFAVYNGGPAFATGLMLDRFIGGTAPDYQGTKPSGVATVWEATITVSFS